MENRVELPNHLRRRIVIDHVSPEVDGGRFAVKRVEGDDVVVEADILCDGHDELECRLLVRHGDTGQWTIIPLECQGNDRWRASFHVDQIGLWQFSVVARIDPFSTWLRDLARREDAGEPLPIELIAGSQIVAAAAHGAPPAVAHEIETLAMQMRSDAWADVARSDRLRELMSLYSERRDETKLETPRRVWVDRQRARWSAWYEVFPRSWGEPGTHGTLATLADRLDSVSGMGFDVLYLAPIHPIGVSFRKGRNNAALAQPDDVGSPWAIGGQSGGHTAIHPSLGNFQDFERLRCRAESLGLELALDLAVQCSPDHPWVKEHPEWFRQRSDCLLYTSPSPRD